MHKIIFLLRSVLANPVLVTALHNRYDIAGKGETIDWKGKPLIESLETVLNPRGKIKGFRFVQFGKD